MDWNSIKIFLAIASHGSLTGAAKHLGVNHSTVFRRLNTFEQDIGGRLFERLHHGYSLTTMGEELLLVANDIAASFDDMERHILGKDFQPKGIVKITAPVNIAYRYLPTLLTEFHQLYPEIRIELLASNLEFNMNNRQADIAIRATSTPPEHLIGRQLGLIRWSVYTSKALKHSQKVPNSLEQLRHYSLIGATAAMQHLPAFIWMEKHMAQQIHIRCDDLVAMSYFAESGQGLAFLPDDQARPEIVKLFTFEPGETSILWLLTHPDLRQVERIKLLTQFLITSFSKKIFV